MWRNTSLAPKFFFWDAFLFIPFLASCLSANKVTIGIFFIVMVFLELLKKRGLSIGVLGLMIRRKIHGDYRPIKISLRCFRRRERW